MILKKKKHKRKNVNLPKKIKTDKTLLLLFAKSNALTPKNAGGSGSLKILSDMGRN